MSDVEIAATDYANLFHHKFIKPIEPPPISLSSFCSVGIARCL